MRGLRASRWLALGGLLLALGCRSAPQTPVITTPLFPDAVIPGPPPIPGGSAPANAPRAIPPAMSMGPNSALILPPGAQLPNANDLRLREPNPDVARIAPPLNNWQASTLKPVEIKPLEIKPLLVAAPGPPAGPDGFAPAPIIPPPEAPRLIAKPLLVESKPAPPPLPLKPGEQFGHASDYRWIAGVLDRHGKGGYWTLRYADFGSDDEWGGKVRLLEDAKLRDLRDGEFVYIEGELLAPRRASGGEGNSYPPYRITSVRTTKEQ